MDFLKEFEKRKREIDEEIFKFLKFDKNVPLTLRKSIPYPIKAGGKRIRSIIALSTYRLCGGKNKEYILPPAVSIELIHTFSLVHDDLPAIDNDDLRRGIPSLHKKFDEATAILTGDALFIYGIEVFLKSKAPPFLKMKALEVLVKAIGPCGVVGGEIYDIEGERKKPNKNYLKKIHILKTAEFFKACFLIGGIFAERFEKLKILESIGLKIGLAFQIVDDILDEIGDEEKMGKGVKKDINKMTYVKVFGVQKAKERAILEKEKAKRILIQNFEESKEREFLENLFDFIVNREH
jgi:geranylgeranyl diphosphate synthase type II